MKEAEIIEVQKMIIIVARKLISVTWYNNLHCVKCVQIRSFFWSVSSRIRTEYGEVRSFSPYSVRMREDKDQKKLLIWTLFIQCQEAPISYYSTTLSQNIDEYCLAYSSNLGTQYPIVKFKKSYQTALTTLYLQVG